MGDMLRSCQQVCCYCQMLVMNGSVIGQMMLAVKGIDLLYGLLYSPAARRKCYQSQHQVTKRRAILAK